MADGPERWTGRSGTDQSQTDEALDDALDRARRGVESGFLELWRALQPRLLRYLAVRSGQAAEDVAAETWLQVVRDMASFSGDIDGFRAWLFTVARHRAIDAGRAAAARPAVPVADIADVIALDARSQVASAESQALDRVSTDSALRLVASLPAPQAEMVMLRVVAGLDVAAVAQIVGKSPGAVRVAVHRALRALSRSPMPVEVSL